MKKAVTGTALACLLAGGSVAEAKTVSYKGKTSGGASITFKRMGNKVSKIRTAVPTICLETTGTGYSTSGSELFQPPGKFKLGKTRKVKKLQPSAMNLGVKVTKNYKVTVKKSGRRKIKGKLNVNFSYFRPNLYGYLPYTYICNGAAKFSAKPK